MRNDYGIRPRATMMKGGKASSKKISSKKADMITKDMPMKKKGKMMKDKR